MFPCSWTVLLFSCYAVGIIGDKIVKMYPPSGSTIVIPITDTTVGIPVEFETQLEVLTPSQVCLDMRNERGTEMFQKVCKDRVETKVSVNNIPAGTYTITLSLVPTDTTVNTPLDSSSAVIYVRSYFDVLPQISWTDAESTFVTRLSSTVPIRDTEVADVELPFVMGHTILPITDLEVCMHVFSNNVLLADICVEIGYSLFTLNGLNTGTYKVELALKHAVDKRILVTAAHTNVVVKSWQDCLPSISFIDPVLEYGMNRKMVPNSIELSNIWIKQDVLLTTAFQSTANNFDPRVFQAHLTAYFLPYSEEIEKSWEFGRLHNDFPLSTYSVIYSGSVGDGAMSVGIPNVGPGVLKVKCVLQFNPAAFAVTSSQVQKEPLTHVLAESGATRPTTILLFPMREMVPTYDWQALHSWQTVPLGMVTRLPLSETATSDPLAHVKATKIPSPWNLQLLLPQVCIKNQKDLRKKKQHEIASLEGGHIKHPKLKPATSFLRTDVTRHTTIASLRKLAEDLCYPDKDKDQFEANCLYISGDHEEILENVELENSSGYSLAQSTVDSSKLFLKRRQLHYRDICV